MDLRPYGLNITLAKEMPPFTSANVQVGYFSKHRGLLVLPSGRYTLGHFLGRGSYSTTYTIHNGATYTIKMIPMDNLRFESVIRECIVHILLEKESADQPAGPYVPRFYEVAYDSYNNLMLLRTETIQDILYDRYKASTAAENDRIIPLTLLQLAEKLEFFYRRLGFNHRDCKPNNVLYNYNPNTGQFDVKIVDFGFACLKWKGISIHAGERFASRDTCYHPSRDLTQFLYATYADRTINVSERLKNVMRDALTFPIEGRVCKMYDRCKAFGIPMEVWAHTYRFLNDPRILNPNATPQALRGRLLEFLPAPIIQGLPSCVPERVINPQTRRCVLRASPKGKTILRVSKRYGTPSPRTLRQHRNASRKLAKRQTKKTLRQ